MSFRVDIGFKEIYVGVDRISSKWVFIGLFEGIFGLSPRHSISYMAGEDASNLLGTWHCWHAYIQAWTMQNLTCGELNVMAESE